MPNIISLSIPDNKNIPNEYLNLSPEENYNIFINGIENKNGNNKIKKNINFRTLAIQAFRDLPEFEIIDLYSVQGHGQGDFQLKFKDFSVLVDAKVYSNNINSKLREKTKQETITNEYCFFGWIYT